MFVPKPGDIFSFQIKPGEFGFGRVLLNIQTQCIDSKLIDKNFRLYQYQKTVLVELFKETSDGRLPDNLEVLIPGILTGQGFLVRGDWKVVGFSKVDPKQVEFPVSLSTEGAFRANFTVGELKIIFDLPVKELEEIGIYPGTFPGAGFPELLLYHLGRKEDVIAMGIPDPEVLNIGNDDLRFSKHKERICKLAGQDLNESYYEKSRRLGFDLSRFYKD